MNDTDDLAAEQEALEQELKAHRHNLRLLRRQAAVYAAGTIPLHLLNQIEYEENAIRDLERQRTQLADRTPTPPAGVPQPERLSLDQLDPAALRGLLKDAFTPQELRRFCYDHDEFRDVLDQFGPDAGINEMVDELITYCDKGLLFSELLSKVRDYNRRQYDRYAGRLYRDVPGASPASGGETP
jgi:hypothetical protein